MAPRPAASVARRCLCLELLFQRYVLETDAEAPVAEREDARRTWLSRDGDLGVAEALTGEERALLERAIGELSEDDLDDLHGRAIGAAVLAWAIGRAPSRPTLAKVEEIVAEHGLLGDGSIKRARAAAEAATLRSEAELDEALGAYLRVRGKAREVDDPERIFAGVAAHHLTWVLGDTMSFDDDIDLD
jgi:hypothetical protein